LTYDRPLPEQKRDRYLRLAERARERAAAASPPVQEAFLQLALSYEVMAGAAYGLALFRQAKQASQINIYRCTRDRLGVLAGQCCCDDCLMLLIAAPRANVAVATRRIGTETGYSRYSGRCDFCGEVRLVTRASPENP